MRVKARNENGLENPILIFSGRVSDGRNHVRACRKTILGMAALACLGAVMALPACAQTVTATVAAGAAPTAVAVNPITNKIYVANVIGASVTVIDGATNTTTTVSVGTDPVAVAVDPVTNNIYVANSGDNNVTVIDGATNATAIVPVGTAPWALAVNAVTNQIYVANFDSGNVTVIDGATNATTTVAAGTDPTDVAVNPVTNKIYVTNQRSSSVTVIDGATNTPTTVAVGPFPAAVAVNPVTNKVYVATDANVTVIDGATNATTSVATGIVSPVAVAVNAATNKIYVAMNVSAEVVVIDGATNTTSLVPAGTYPTTVTVDSLTNEIYVGNQTGPNVTVINGATNATTTVLTAATTSAIAVNPATNKIYVTSQVSSGFVTVIDGATYTPPSVAGGPFAAAVVNPATNTIYAAGGNNNLTVIDGTTYATTTEPIGTNPGAMAVNPITNKIYAVDNDTDTVTVIDGATYATTTLSVGKDPISVAVNPLTNKIYVGISSSFVTIIDGATYAMTTVASGPSPYAFAVNPATNKIYVMNEDSGIVTAIDGITNATTTILLNGGSFQPYAIALNPVTNKLYVASPACCIGGLAPAAVIDGATNVPTTLWTAAGTWGVAVNSVTNKAYFAAGNSVVVVDGATNAITTVSTGLDYDYLGPIFVNEVTNKIYAPIYQTNTMTVIDGATNTTTTVPIPSNLFSLAVNPATSEVYDTNPAKIEENVEASPLTTTITPLTGDVTTSATPTFSFTTATTYAPTAPAVLGVYYQVDTWQGPWLAAEGGGNAFSGQTGPLGYGPHVLYAYAGDTQVATANGLSSPVIGNIVGYFFTVVPPSTTTSLVSSLNPAQPGASVMFTATVTEVAPGIAVPTGNVALMDGATTLATIVLNGSGVATFTTNALVLGTNSLSAVYGGDSNNLASTSAVLVETIAQNSATQLTIQNPSFETTNSLTYSCGGGCSYNDGLRIPGWTITGEGGSFQPNSAALTLPAGDGQTVAYSDGGMISQVLTSTLQANSTYTLSVDVGHRLDGYTTNYTIELVAGGTVLNSVTGNSASLPAGTLTTQTVSYTSPVTVTAGQQLEIVLISSGVQSDFDNVTLTVGASKSGPTQTPSVTLVSSENPALPGTDVTFTTVATVVSGAAIPTGTVTFMNGATTLASVTLNASAVATFSTSTLAAGTHSLTAVYGGDANNLASTSAVLVETIAQNSATQLTIQNPSFETTNSLTYSCGGGCSYNDGLGIPGWTITGEGGSFQPNSAALTLPAGDGQTVAYSDGGMISQVLTSTLQANSTYTLSVDVGHRLDGYTTNYTIELVAGGTVLNSVTGNSASLPAGTLTTQTVSYTSPVTVTAGQQLEIVLISSGVQSDFDNVTLTVAASNGSVLAIQNPSFEMTNGLNWSCGSGCSYNDGLGIPGWTITGEGGSFQPNSAALTLPAGDGQTVAYSDGGMISQVLTSTLQANSTYTLSVDVGHRLDGYTTNYTIELVAGGTVLNSVTGNSASLPAGTLTTQTVSYTSPSTVTAGQQLEIVLISSGGQSDFDNVTLTQVTSTIFAYVMSQTSGTVDAYEMQANGALEMIPGSPFTGGVSPTAGAADRSDKFLYVANTVPSEVSGYLIATDGALQPLPGSPFATGSGPASVTVDPQGHFAYTLNCGSDCSGTGPGNISAFTISGTGALTPVPGSPFTAGEFPYEMAVQSSGDFAYVVNRQSGTVSGYAIQPSGALAQIAGSPFATGTFPISVAITPQNNFLFTANTGSNNVSVFAINADGSLTPVPGSPFSTGAFTASVTVDSTGQFAYVAAGAGVYAFAIGANGTLTPVPGSPFVAGLGPNWISIDPTNHFAFVVNTGADTISGYALNQATGELTPVPGSPFGAGSHATAIVIASVPQ